MEQETVVPTMTRPTTSTEFLRYCASGTTPATRLKFSTCSGQGIHTGGHAETSGGDLNAVVSSQKNGNAAMAAPETTMR